METNYVYIVTFDGYLWGYGAEIYLLGVYSSRELAEEAVNSFKKRIAERDDIDCNIEPDIKAIVVDHTYEFCPIPFRQAIERVQALPSADRPQGEWIEESRHEDSEWLSPMADFYKCSICGKRVNLFQMRSYRFCPNCGARMKGADDE